MSEQSISLLDLLDLAIGSPNRGAVNFSALHTLLHAVLIQLGIRDTKTRWRGTPLVVGVSEIQDQEREEQEVHPGAEVNERATSPSSSPPPLDLEASSSSESKTGWQTRVQSRVQSCEDSVSEALKMIEELQGNEEKLQQEVKELRLEQEGQKASAVETCCHRVDALEESMRYLTDSFHKYPDADELSQYVTRNILQSALLSEREILHKELLNSGVVDPAAVITPSQTFSSPRPDEGPKEPPGPTAPPAPASNNVSGQMSNLQDQRDSQTDVEPTAVPPVSSDPTLPPIPTVALVPTIPLDPTVQSVPSERSEPSKGRLGSEKYPETVEALRNMGKLKERFSSLEARVSVLEDGKVDQSELGGLRELITSSCSHEALKEVKEELDQQKVSIKCLMSDREKNSTLETDVQTAILQLKADCERLCESNRQKQSHIEVLYKTTEELKEKKADKHMVESEIKSDKLALDSKVSRLQFDSVTEQLSGLFHELLNKVTGHEQDWHKVIARISTEMECKLNRLELDSVKKQLEDLWRNIQQKPQALGLPEHEDAAGLRKQLVDNFHCLSCDRPVVKYNSSSHLVKLPSGPGFPSHRSIRPFTVYALEQFRQPYRSERVFDPSDPHLISVSRSCGGSHTVTSAVQRRSGLPYSRVLPQTETEGLVRSEEVDIVGLDGHIYKGRLNVPAIRSTETKLPTISSKDGVCKTKDRSRCSPSHKPPTVSPDVAHTATPHPHSTKSQGSRSASSTSGRDWSVSALGCTSQGSIAPASAVEELPDL